MGTLTTRLASPQDAHEIARMLALLAKDLGDGDVFSSTPDTIARYGFGPDALFHTMIAMRAGKPAGFALFFAHFSTTRAQPGAYVQDLWVDQKLRGLSVGRVLLNAVAHYAFAEWQAAYIALSVHADNLGAARFYQHLGFEAQANERPVALKGDAFQRLLQGGNPAP